jgi:hypothetical protein
VLDTRSGPMWITREESLLMYNDKQRAKQEQTVNSKLTTSVIKYIQSYTKSLISKNT